MNSIAKASPSPAFLRFGAACCVYYIAAQLVQQLSIYLGINDSATGEAEILQRLTTLDQLRAVLILLGFTLIPIVTAFAGVALRRFRFRPAASLLGFAFAVLFVASEMSVRSIDFFLVSRNWAAEYGAAPSALKAAILERISVWDGAVGAFYFALLAVHMLSSICFAIAVWDRNERWSLAAALGFAAAAMTGIGRLLEGYLGQSWMDGLNHAVYIPVVVVNFGTLGAWLWRQAKEAGKEQTLG
jgi:hypothetical protein